VELGPRGDQLNFSESTILRTLIWRMQQNRLEGNREKINMFAHEALITKVNAYGDVAFSARVSPLVSRVVP
jgi:hypothetical protein